MRKQKTKAAPAEPDLSVVSLTREELLELKLAEMEAKLIASQAAHITLQKMVYLNKIDPQGLLAEFDRVLAVRGAEQTRVAARHTAVKANIEARLGLKLDQVSFDDETGAIHTHG